MEALKGIPHSYNDPSCTCSLCQQKRRNREKNLDVVVIPDSQWFTMSEAEWRTAQLEKLKKPYVPPEHPEELEEGSA